MKAVFIIGCVLLYVLIGMFMSRLATSARKARREAGEIDATPLSDGMVGFCILIWPIWTVIGIVMALGRTANRSGSGGQ